MAKQRISRQELIELAAGVACSQFNARPSGGGVYGVFSAPDLAWVRKNRVKIRRSRDGSVRVDVIYSAAYQRELEEYAEKERKVRGQPSI